MTPASAESDSFRRCVLIGGVAGPTPPQLLLDEVLFSSIGDSLLRVPIATGDSLDEVAFQLGKNWAKSQSFSICFTVMCGTFKQFVSSNAVRVTDRMEMGRIGKGSKERGGLDDHPHTPHSPKINIYPTLFHVTFDHQRIGEKNLIMESDLMTSTA